MESVTFEGADEQGPIARLIIQKLSEALKPAKLYLRDDSASHAGHVAMQNAT